MSLAADAGQLLWVGFDGRTVPEELARRISAGAVGGVVLFGRNLTGRLEETAALCRALQDAAGELPLVLAVDQEGGRVQRLKPPFLALPPMARLGELDDAELAQAVGRALGTELGTLGFNVDFAPVLDVHTNPKNPVIGDRAFSTTPGAVARLGGAFLRGLESTGVLGCAKHFPGHGDTDTDSHLALPRVTHSLERMHAVELAPFSAAISAGASLVMTAHVMFDALDPGVPATLSPRVVGELLRSELGFSGVCVSDDLEMKAIADHYGVPEAGVRAVRAGCDALLVCRNVTWQVETHEALVRQAERSSELRARLGAAADRVRALRRRLGRPSLDPTAAAARFPFSAHAELARRVGLPVGPLSDPTETGRR